MLTDNLIKVYYDYNKWKKYFSDYLDSIHSRFKKNRIIFWLSYTEWNSFFHYKVEKKLANTFENTFYTKFWDFQIEKNHFPEVNYSTVGTIFLEKEWFVPFKLDSSDNTDFIYSILRNFDQLDFSDKVSFFVELFPISNKSIIFNLKFFIRYFLFNLKLFILTPLFLLRGIDKKQLIYQIKENILQKREKQLFKVKIYIGVYSKTKQSEINIIKNIFKSFLIFQDETLNQFKLKITKKFHKNIYLTSEEISNFFHFPKNPVYENSLIKLNFKKLPLPSWIPVFSDTNSFKKNITPIGISDYRSNQQIFWLYKEDRLKHMYVIWKTWTWKTKFLENLILNDIKDNIWVFVLDPHWDLTNNIISNIPNNRIKDVIIFDPTVKNCAFSFNPLSINSDEWKQVLVKGFLDNFKKFFSNKWNEKLEHVLRMIILSLLDYPQATLFDIIKILTDRDFRYQVIEHIKEDVVRNFWINEFASWNENFNSQAIIPIINQIWQILAIDSIKNIFSSRENKLNFKNIIKNNKILIVKLAKWELQEEVVGFIWNLFISKLYQTALSMNTEERKYFFMYIDEFQNFATDIFKEISSEARKFKLWFTIAHQYLNQIPKDISDAIFWNIGTIISFKVSSQDWLDLEKHFNNLISWYDLANLDSRHFYCKTIVQWENKNPFSAKTLDVNSKIDYSKIQAVYNFTSKNYCNKIQTNTPSIVKSEEFEEPLV